MALTKDGQPLSREDFRKMAQEAEKQKRVNDAESAMHEKIVAENKTVLAPAYSKGEKDKERRDIEKMIRAGFDAAEVTFKSTGKTGEWAIRMPQGDYTIKITKKKEKMEILD